MAKKRPSGKKSERVAPASAPAVPRKKKPVPPRTDYSLDDILAEFRSGGEKTPEVPAAPAAGGESVPSPLTETETGLTPAPENAEPILRQEVGEVFRQVLEDAGVYKRTQSGRAAFLRFAEAVNRAK